MMRVLVTDFTFPSLEIERAILEPFGWSIDGRQCRTAEELIAAVPDADAIITQFAPVRNAVVSAMNKARVIVRYGIGVDSVDLESARKNGIPVCNVPDYCIDEVADHTLAFILAATRQVVVNANLVRDGKWGLATPLDGMRTLRDQTIGIVGFGRIGREVAARLSAFKCRRLVTDAFVPTDAIHSAGCEPVSLDELLTLSDIVTLHCPSTPQTRKLLNADSIARMKQGAIVINLARGDLIDTPALVAGLQSGHLAATAIDVSDPEPIPLDSPLRSMPNVIAASHIASASANAVKFLRETVSRIVALALQGEPLPNVVNGVTVARFG